MKKLTLLLIAIITASISFAQTTLTEAVNFHVKTIYGETIWLFPLLDDEDKIVVVDFFSTTCGPCQDYAPDFQACYEKFGYNESNVYFMGINWGNDNNGVKEFDSIFGLTFPTASGSQGGGNIVFGDYDILSYPTVLLITPDHNIVEQYIWYPNEENITNAVLAAGGIMVGSNEITELKGELKTYPNPVSDKGIIEFELQNSAKIKLAIYNILGNQVYSTNEQYFEKGINKIPFFVNELSSGYYFAKITTSNGNIFTTRISVSN